MNQIFEKIINLDSSNSDAVKETVGSFVQQLQQHGRTNPAKWLETVQYVIDRFPKYCMSHRNTIETHVAHYLDSDTCYYVIEAAKCEHLLQQVRPVSEKNATPKSLWRDQLSLLCTSAHDLVGDIFVNATYIHATKKDTNTADKSPMSSILSERRNLGHDMTKESALCRKLRNIFIFIQAMLVEVYPVSKLVAPQTVLDVVIQTLSVTSGDPGAVDALWVAEVKAQALRTLDALVQCLGANLIPFSPLIFRLVMQTLKWSSENSDDIYSRGVRAQAYVSLSGWLAVLRASGREMALGEQLLPHLRQDVATPGDTLHINVNINCTRNLSKKAKRKLATTSLQESNLAARANPQHLHRSAETDDELAIAALECAEVFLDTCGLFLKPNTHKTLQELIVRECLEMERHSEERGLRLCRVLEALRKTSSGGPAHYALHIYSTLAACARPSISRYISQALLNIRLHLHRSPPPLYFPAEPEQLPASSLSKHTVSERNRAALQQLLGRDRLSSDEENNEITDSDEDVDEQEPRSSNDSDNTDADDENDDVDSVEVLDSEQTDEAPPNKKHKYANSTEDKSLKDGDKEVAIEISDTEIETHDLTENDDIQILNVGSTDKNKIEVSQKQTEEPVIECIHDMETQLVTNEANDAVDGSQNSEHSIEVAYDYPNSAKENVVIFDETECGNLPSTNETDDIELDCGQTIKSSQDVTPNKENISKTTLEGPITVELDGGQAIIISQDITPNKDNNSVSAEEIPITNGVNNMDLEMNINIDKNELAKNTVTPKVVTAEGEMTVEEMMADFVNEVVEEAPTNT